MRTFKTDVNKRSWQVERWLVTSITIAFAVFAFACSGGGGGGDGDGDSAVEVIGEGIALPSEVSAVSTTVDDEEVASARYFFDDSAFGFAALHVGAAFATGSADVPADSDYHTVQVRKFVEVRALEVFDILSSIFDALRQTHYVDHVGDGWYKVMVAFQDEGGDGANQTRLQEWYVNSRMFDDGTGAVSRLRLKIIEENGPGGPEMILVEMEISAAPTENEDGSLADMGEWEIRALFGDSEDDFFHATSTVLSNGQSRITLEESGTDDEGPGGEMTFSTRAIIVRSATEGYGVVEYPAWDQCQSEGACSNGPPDVSVAFAYNENYLTLDPEGGSSTSFDRDDDHELVHRYMLFDGVTGDHVDKT